jgi:hypothetical protein
MKVTVKLLYLGFLFLTACGGDGGEDGDGGSTPTPTPNPEPKAATLIFPDNNSTCVEGIVLSLDNNRITFQWSEAENADSYTLTIRNITNGTELNKESKTNEAAVLLDRGTPYQWFVVSKSSSTTATATSATWKFFNAGDGIINYAPFPAEAVAPARGEQIQSAGTVTLEWAADDVDDDITGFDIYVDTSSDFTAAPTSTEENTLDITVASGQTYFWKVITFDSAGNNSQSEIFEFSVK